MAYLPAWIIIVVMALVGSVGLLFLTRPMRPSAFRSLIRILPAVLLVVPAPVPGYPGAFAPAFVVLIFEGLFQREGSALGAATILGAAVVLTTLLVVVAHRFARARDKGVEASKEN